MCAGQYGPSKWRTDQAGMVGGSKAMGAFWTYILDFFGLGALAARKSASLEVIERRTRRAL